MLFYRYNNLKTSFGNHEKVIEQQKHKPQKLTYSPALEKWDRRCADLSVFALSVSSVCTATLSVMTFFLSFVRKWMCGVKAGSSVFYVQPETSWFV